MGGLTAPRATPGEPSASTGTEAGEGVAVRTGDSADSPRQPVEIGLVVVGEVDETTSAALEGVRDDLGNYLREWFPMFDWRIDVVRRERIGTTAREEAIVLLEQGRDERDSREWDFVVVLAPCELTTHYKPFALAVVARAFDAAVLSTVRLDPRPTQATIDSERRVEIVRQRLLMMTLHVLGHLNGLGHADSPSSPMFELESVDDLGRMREYEADEREAMLTNLREIADLRLEEREEGRSPFRPWFYLRGIWVNLHEIRNAVREARPWEFPMRLSRLTAAAVAAALVLMITAETWEVAAGLDAPTLAILVAGTLVSTTAYVVARGGLLVRRRRRRISEQTVVTNTSVVAIVLCGMLSTFLLLFGASLLGEWLLFRPSLVADWTSAPVTAPPGRPYLSMATCVASLGLVVGALGTSFEEQHHFRHVIFVDEEA